MSERDELDLLIDSGLARYADPRPGLEQRILARVEAESFRRSSIFRGWRPWALTGAVAIALAVLFAVPRAAHREASVTTARAISPDHETGARRENAVPDVQVRSLPRAVRSVPRATRVQKATDGIEETQRPKLNVFPAPRPPSAQELALVAVATAPSDSGREGLMVNQRQMDAPLQISAIQITPITMPDEGKN